MSAVLRAIGGEFDVEAYLRGCTLPHINSFKRGDPVFPRSQPNGRRRQSSGINARVSTADFDQFPQQIIDAVEYLKEHGEGVKRLRAFPGIEAASLDLGIWRRDVFMQCDQFPTELVRLAGALDLSLELSVYRREPPIGERQNDTV